jgi:hypothetical protein
MHEVGVRALRLSKAPTNAPLLARADSLGLQLFVDLPVAYVSAPTLGDSLNTIRPLLNRLQQLALRHESIRYVGLAQGANTTNPATCETLQEWTRQIHEESSLRTYYVTPFAASADRCTDATDLTLLDTRGHQRPVAHWQKWTDDQRPVGFGALGTWVTPHAGAGLLVPHSADQQARYLERALTAVADSLASSPPIFVHRWQDQEPPLLNTRRYGLHTASGSPRPAASVLEGVYTGSQRVFAFPSGTAPSAAPHAFVVLGWGLLGLLGGLYARNPYVRETAIRYFAAHGFYRDALQEGRDMNPTVNVLLLLTVGVSVGMIATLCAHLITTQPSTVFVLEALPPSLRQPIASGLAQPLLSGAILGGVTFLLLSAWMIVLSLAAGPQTAFSVSQSLMLVVWPCWPALGGMLLALVAATTPPAPPDLLGLALLLGGIGTLLAVNIRILRDYRAVTQVSAAKTMALLIPSPLLLIVSAMAAIVLSYDLPLPLLWQLAAHT